MRTSEINQRSRNYQIRRFGTSDLSSGVFFLFCFAFYLTYEIDLGHFKIIPQILGQLLIARNRRVSGGLLRAVTRVRVI